MLSIQSTRSHFVLLAGIALFVATMAVLYNSGIGQPATRFAQVAVAALEPLAATGRGAHESTASTAMELLAKHRSSDMKSKPARDKERNE